MAAQTSGLQPATVRLLADQVTRSLTLQDRVSFDDAPWNITGIVPIGRHEIELTVVRAA